MIAELLGRRRILIVEDDWVVALDMSDMVEELGGAVVGPAGQLAQGLALMEPYSRAFVLLSSSMTNTHERI